jgi:cytochrome c
MTAIASKQGAVDANAQSAGGWAIIAKNDCRACHSVTEKVLGPSFTQVGLKYKDDAGAAEMLAKKIRTGGSGNWGDAMMPAHPGLSDGDVKSIVKYVLSLAYAPPKAKPLPVSGTYTTNVPDGKNTEGSFILRAAYTDRGAKGIAAQTGEQTLVLNAPTLSVSKASESHDIYFGDGGNRAQIKNTGWLRFNRIDLNGIKQISLVTTGAVGNGTVELHANSPKGKLIASGGYGSSINIPGGQGIADLYFVFNGSPVNVRAIKFSDGN